MPAHSNPLIESEFTRSQGPQNKKSSWLTCKHCTNFNKAHNSTRALEHLKECEGFKAKQQQQQTTIEAINPSQKRQRTLTLASYPSVRRQKLDSLAASAIYMGARPFRLWEDPYMMDFVGTATQQAYFPPTRERIGGELLDQEYNNLYNQIEHLVQTQSSLNFVLDESTNISSHRIINFSVVIPRYGLIYLSNQDVGKADLDASFFTSWFVKKASKYNLSQVISLTTDTCATMRSTWTGIESLKELSHALFIPCDSHGLQLLIEDLLHEPPIAALMIKAHEIVNCFHKSKKQYAILRSKLEKPHSLVLSMITRWGTQLMLITSLLKYKAALFSWLGDPQAQMGKKKGENSLAAIITDHSFWINLSSIEQIIHPIHEAQKMLESDGATLGNVVPRWQKLESELHQLSIMYSSLLESFMVKDGPFQQRARKQITNLHYAAMLLDPISLLKHHGESIINRGSTYLLSNCKDDISKKCVHSSFLEYRTRTGVFGATHPSALHHDTPIAYWKSYLLDDTHSGLASLAVRIFEAVVNSVASERAFSVMNLIHSKLHNRLGAEKADKLIYIYMNQRVLARNRSIFLGDPIEKTQEEQVELEESILEMLDQEEIADN